MKRGHLLRAEAKKVAAKRRLGAQNQTVPPLAPSTLSTSKSPPVPQDIEGEAIESISSRISGCNADNQNLTEEKKAPPSVYELNKSRHRLVYKVFDPSIPGNTRVVAVPQSVPDGETQCQWITNGSTEAKVLNALAGYPVRIPKPCRPGLYQVRSTPDKGIGLFAKRDIKCGDIFLAERPLLVVPHATKSSQGPIPAHYAPQQIKEVIMLEFESLLQYTVSRLSSESQADYRALHNAHTADGSGPLLGIMRSNAYDTGKLYDGADKNAQHAKYGAVCKIGSRINHSCIPNVGYSFSINSFSIQFHALRDIKAGEELCYSYCSTESTRAQRQACLAPYGFVCKCPACVNATPETDKLRTTFGSQITLLSQMVVAGSSRVDEGVLEGALRLEKDMVREGLDADPQFAGLLASISLGYRNLGKMKEGDTYFDLVKAIKTPRDYD